MSKFLNYDETLKICSALGSKTRLDIIRQIKNKPNINLNELAENLKLTNGALTSHIKMLEDLEIVKIDLISAKRGSQKICSLYKTHFNIDLLLDFDNNYSDNIPIGLFCDFYTNDNCGIATINQIINEINNKNSFLFIERIKAKILWFCNGHISYYIPNHLSDNEYVNSLEFSLELSTAIENIKNYSMCKLEINDIYICDFKVESISDLQNIVHCPHWWSYHQYGRLFKFKINNIGTFLNDTQISKVTIDKLNLTSNSQINLKLFCDLNGITIFGNGFGVYNQDIKINMTTHYINNQ